MLLLISTVKLVKDIHQQISASVTDRTMRNIVIPVVCSLALCCTTTKVKINKSVFSLGCRLSTGHCPHLLVNTVLLLLSTDICSQQGTQQQTRSMLLSFDATDRRSSIS